MKTVSLFSFLAAVALRAHAVALDLRDLPITREGSTLRLAGEPWKAVGANIYWLGMDENVIPPPGQPFYAPYNASYPTKGRVSEIMAMVQALGGTVLTSKKPSRGHTLGVSVGNPLSVMPAPGEINAEAFESIDWAVYQARQYGLRLLIPLVDNYDYYHGGKYVFLRWAGFNLTQTADSTNPEIMQFYTNATIIDAFKGYVFALLTHINPYTGLSYASDPTIFAYESGNELAGPVWGDMDVPNSWTSEMGDFVKALAPAKLFMDGTYGVNETHLALPQVDMFSDHFYPTNLTLLQSDLDLVASVDKVYFAGEYNWILDNDGDTAAELVSWYQMLEKSPVAGGSTFWSLFGHDVPNCNIYVNHSDGFTLQYGNPANSALTNSSIDLIRQHNLIMREGGLLNANVTVPLPAVPCPASPLGRRREQWW